jgi:hypothetical protein
MISSRNADAHARRVRADYETIVNAALKLRVYENLIIDFLWIMMSGICPDTSIRSAVHIRAHKQYNIVCKVTCCFVCKFAHCLQGNHLP